MLKTFNNKKNKFKILYKKNLIKLTKTTFKKVNIKKLQMNYNTKFKIKDVKFKNQIFIMKDNSKIKFKQQNLKKTKNKIKQFNFINKN